MTLRASASASILFPPLLAWPFTSRRSSKSQDSLTIFRADTARRSGDRPFSLPVKRRALRMKICILGKYLRSRGVSTSTYWRAYGLAERHQTSVVTNADKDDQQISQ